MPQLQVVKKTTTTKKRFLLKDSMLTFPEISVVEFMCYNLKRSRQDVQACHK